MVRSFKSQGRSFAVSGRAFDPVPVTAKTIDSFEDQDLSEYSGDTGSFNFSDIQTDFSISPVDGTYVLQSDQDGQFNEIVSTSGLENYFSKGDVAKCYIRFDQSSADQDYEAQIRFGASGVDDHYNVEFNAYNGDIILRKEVTGTTSGLSRLDNVGIDTGFWYEVKITWDDGTLGGSDNDITVEISDFSDGSSIGTIGPVNDSSHATNEGIGFMANDNFSTHIWYDYYHLP